MFDVSKVDVAFAAPNTNLRVFWHPCWYGQGFIEKKLTVGNSLASLATIGKMYPRGEFSSYLASWTGARPDQNFCQLIFARAKIWSTDPEQREGIVNCQLTTPGY